jgi:Domain of unknown function (DUF932)
MKEKKMITTLDQKHTSRSDKYQLVATKEIAERFKNLGFVVDGYSERRVRDATRRGYQKHQVRLSNPDLLQSTHSDIKLQLVVTNSHDGTSSFKMALGFFRFVCSNGLMVGETFERVSLRHSGTIVEEIEESIDRMVAQVSRLDSVISKMKERVLSKEELGLFLAEAGRIRGAAFSSVPEPRREGDVGDDLFTVLNRIQEASIRGGETYVNQNGRTRSMRALTNIDKLTTVNQELFTLAEKLVA